MHQNPTPMNQPMMAGYPPPTTVTTDIIQQYLDENKQLILAILDNQNSGKLDECARNQAKLQSNLMFLAAIADNQSPQSQTASQYPLNTAMQSGPRYMQAQQGQLMTPQSLMAARSSMLYAQSPLSALQQQQQAATLHGQLGMNSSGTATFSMFQGEASIGGNRALNTGIFSDFGRSSATEKLGTESSLAAEFRGVSSGAQSAGGAEPMYLKGSEQEGS